MIYEYECKECEVLIEIQAPIEHEKPCCEKCSNEMKKKISVSSFVLKGSGWARDNYGLKR